MWPAVDIEAGISGLSEPSFESQLVLSPIVRLDGPTINETCFRLGMHVAWLAHHITFNQGGSSEVQLTYLVFLSLPNLLSLFFLFLLSSKVLSERCALQLR
ncbi:hypothetical protein E1B28_013255 [Marasmius oreades]|uniref:Uncharacterized protein n=1 Tax=Marasmius oreades TaxID=181124 RepID=A0A9P7RPV0_9AGAR|nr:uncharacterized protein E1B28_013255 [Marasmius oreades]KAG7087277.1 hypothetical protein E1B28_013255 [Marasmius oreades]